MPFHKTAGAGITVEEDVATDSHLLKASSVAVALAIALAALAPRVDAQAQGPARQHDQPNAYATAFPFVHEGCVEDGAPGGGGGGSFNGAFPLSSYGVMFLGIGAGSSMPIASNSVAPAVPLDVP